jgi:hypothetical protein
MRPSTVIVTVRRSHALLTWRDYASPARPMGTLVTRAIRVDIL